MNKVLELSEETYQQLATLAAYQQRPLEEMLRLCLLAYEQYQYHLVHQQMVAEGLLEALPPLRALDAAGEGDDDFEPEVIPGKPLSEIILEERRICGALHIRGYVEFRNMRSQQLTPSGIQSKSTDVLRIFLASFGTTKTLEEANTEVIEAKNTALLLASAPASALRGS